MAKRFVIQEHTREGKIHWDLMLEREAILETWQLDKSPEQIKTESAAAKKIFDHDVKFLSYEGLVNNGLGKIRIADKGTFHILHETEQKIETALTGKILSGEFILEHVQNERWKFSVLARGSES